MTDLTREFLDAMSLVAATVNVVTTDGNAGRSGVTVSAMSSVSAEAPDPTLLVCINASSSGIGPILKNRVFCLNVLNSNQAGVANMFAGRAGVTGDARFAGASWVRGHTGSPILDGALVAFDCHIVHSLAVGSHHVLFGAVREVRTAGPGSPLIYHNRGYAIPQPLDQPAAQTSAANAADKVQPFASGGAAS